MRNGRISGGSALLAVVAVAAATLLATRLLPPLAAEAHGRLRRGDPFERLAADHRAILDVLRRMAAARGARQRLHLLARLKRRLAAHAMAEEDIVYPLLDREAGARAEVRQFYAEHAEMKMQLYALETLADGGHGADGDDWGQHVRELHRVVARHVHEEEIDAFPRLRQLLDRPRLSAVSGQVQREKAMLL